MAGTPLREAQKALTRERLLTAARLLFHRDGYAAVTLDQIAKQAGTQRTTLYAHFKDKEEMLHQLVNEYAAQLIPVLETLPGPLPNRAEIDRWMLDMARFTHEQMIATILFSGFGTGAGAPRAIEQLGERMFATLARKLPAFDSSRQSGRQKAETVEWARAFGRQLSVACVKQESARSNQHEFRAALGIAGDLLEMFLHRSGGRKRVR